MAEKIQIHRRNIEARIEGLKEWKTPEKNKEDLVLFKAPLNCSTSAQLLIRAI